MNMNNIEPALSRMDGAIISFFKKMGMPVARIALAVVFFWFGILKVVGESPASPLVASLLEKTLPFITADQFIFWLGIYEMIVGLAFLIPHCERFAIFLLLPHLVTTTMPLILLKPITWQSPFIPTLEGQYIIKNLLIIATAIGIASHLEPMHPRHPQYPDPARPSKM